jgi:DNA-binding NarL/FixJ family response regulator
MAPLTERARAPMAVRVVIAHPMRAWAESLETLLEPRGDVTVVESHTRPEWLRQAVLDGSADVLLVHVSESLDHLAAFLDEVRSSNPALAVVALCESVEPALVLAAVHAGIRGWVAPTASADQLVRVLTGAARGETWFPPRLLTDVLDGLLEAAKVRRHAVEVGAGLSEREVHVLRCLAIGLTRRQIADRYYLSPHTVRTHVNNVLHKLDVHSTLAAVAIARQMGLAEPAEQYREDVERDTSSRAPGGRPRNSRPLVD